MSQETRVDLTNHPGVSQDFYHPCLDCGSNVRVVGSQDLPHECDDTADTRAKVAHAFWQGHDAAAESYLARLAREKGSEES